jgi:hypothetical protein
MRMQLVTNPQLALGAPAMEAKATSARKAAQDKPKGDRRQGGGSTRDPPTSTKSGGPATGGGGSGTNAKANHLTDVPNNWCNRTASDCKFYKQDACLKVHSPTQETHALQAKADYRKKQREGAAAVAAASAQPTA